MGSVTDYSPTIFLRQAELKGLGNLPEFQKDRLLPLFSLQPFLRSAELTNSLQKIEDCFANRPYLVAVDPYYRPKKFVGNAQLAFAALKDSTSNYGNWVNYVLDLPNAIPCLQGLYDVSTLAQEQANVLQNEGRQFAVRIRREHPLGPDSAFLNLIQSIDPSDYILVLDRGWDRDVLNGFSWLSGIISSLREIIEMPPVILTGSSFIADFQQYSGSRPGRIGILERSLFDQLRLRYPDVDLSYGDWSSSRPPSEERASRPRARLDLPTSTEWRIYRSENPITDDLTSDEYRDLIAKDLVTVCEWAADDPEYMENVELWGYEQIAATAEGLGGPIGNNRAAAAVRINIHLFRQVYYGAPALPTEMDDPFVE